MSTATLTHTPAPAAPATRTSSVHDLRLLVGRALRRDSRMLDAMIVNVVLPVAIMITFVYVFGGAIDTGTGGLPYIDFVVPAVMLMSGGYGAAATAAAITEDMTGGMIDRFRTLPVASWTVPASHVVASLARNLATTGIALAVAFALGFRPDATVLDWLLVVVVVAAYILTVSAMAVVWGLLVRSVQAASAFSFAVLFVPYVSDAFVPVESMPAVLRAFAEHQPTTPLVETLRSLLLDLPLGDAGWWTAAWLALGTVVAVPAAAVLFRRRTAR
ncbi:ABC transporter permease [Georgenia subflava]|uniref:Transport permease protein n=1 Tax=Georgenia subflava TaxID=1622177 RepID=A0A6N7EJP4_9MICO|nr:ABC transporter permease [Georgenia subflava]MPV36977.1 ABC transporter permease [Georgenia subflava]